MLKLSAEISSILRGKPFETLMHFQGDVFRLQGDRETVRISLDKTYYFIKRYRRDIFTTGAKGEWEALRICERLGVPAPALKGFGASGMRSFVLMEALEGSESLEFKTPAGAEKMLIIHQIADIARTLHTKGYFHRDFYICHFFWNPSSQKITLIDLHRLFKPVLLKQHYLEKDLSALLFSSFDLGLTQRDVFRFLKRYFNKPLRDILKSESPLLIACQKKAISLYQKAYLHSPGHISWLMHQQPWPHQVGAFHQALNIDGDVFNSDTCLRVFPKRRMVLSGQFRGQHVIYKYFTHQTEYQRELDAYQKFFGADKIIAHSDNDRYFVTPFIDGQHLRDLSPVFLTTLAQLHNRGLLQSDAHLGNFIIDTEQTIHILDPSSIRSFHSEDQALDNLALIFAEWSRDLDNAHLDLLPIYVKARGQEWSDTVKHDFAHRLKKARDYRLKKWISKRCRASTNLYAKSRYYTLIYAKRVFADVYAQTLMRFPESYFTVDSVVRANIGKAEVVIKRYPLKSIWHFFKNSVKGSEARRVWKNVAFLNFIGIKTPEPLAMIEKRFFYIPLTSYIVTKSIAGETLDKIDLKSLPEKTQEKITVQMQRCQTLLSLSHLDPALFSPSDWLWDGENIYLINLEVAI